VVLPVLLLVLVPPLVTLPLPVPPVTLLFPVLVSHVHQIVMSVPLPMLVLLVLLHTFGTLVVHLVIYVTLSVTNVLVLLLDVLLVKLLSKLLLLLPMVLQLPHIFLKLPPPPSVKSVVLLPKLLVSVLHVLLVMP
jgi:hypothetical protein